MCDGPWQVWFYAPSGERRLIDRFNTRSEAEQHRARLGRLLGNPALLVVCFELPDGETTDDFSSPPRLNAADLWRA
jgi:hypothetical protein